MRKYVRNEISDSDIANAERILRNCGIDSDNAPAVIQLLGYALLDEELYPDAGPLCFFPKKADDDVPSCVVITHSFDPEVLVYQYDNDEEAANALRQKYMSYLEEEKREGSILVDSECFCCGDYAKVAWADGAVTEFSLSYITKEETA